MSKSELRKIGNQLLTIAKQQEEKNPLSVAKKFYRVLIGPSKQLSDSGYSGTASRIEFVEKVMPYLRQGHTILCIGDPTSGEISGKRNQPVARACKVAQSALIDPAKKAGFKVHCMEQGNHALKIWIEREGK